MRATASALTTFIFACILTQVGCDFADLRAINSGSEGSVPPLGDPDPDTDDDPVDEDEDDDPPSPPPVCYARAGVVLALDNSGSLNNAETQQMKQAANLMVDAFDLHLTEGIVMGVTRFRGNSVSVWPVSANPTALHLGINAIVQGGPDLENSTNMVAAVQGGSAQFSTGVASPPGYPKIMIVITDGDDTDGNSNTAIRNAALASGATIFAIGVGYEIDPATLRAITGLSTNDRVFQAADYLDLQDQVEDIVAMTCPED